MARIYEPPKWLTILTDRNIVQSEPGTSFIFLSWSILLMKTICSTSLSFLSIYCLLWAVSTKLMVWVNSCLTINDWFPQSCFSPGLNIDAATETQAVMMRKTNKHSCGWSHKGKCGCLESCLECLSFIASMVITWMVKKKKKTKPWWISVKLNFTWIFLTGSYTSHKRGFTAMVNRAPQNIQNTLHEWN